MGLLKWRQPTDIERIFDFDFPQISLPKFGWDLACDVYEKDGSVITQMNLPGIDPEKIDISIDGNVLRISGTREEEKETKDKGYYSKEIKRGSFERVVELPVEVDSAKAEAEYANGVLTITTSKQEQSKEKVKIKVKK